jgi:hypothetical protein
LVDAGSHDLRACVTQRSGHCIADAAGTSGDRRDASLEIA